MVTSGTDLHMKRHHVGVVVVKLILIIILVMVTRTQKRS